MEDTNAQSKTPSARQLALPSTISSLSNVLARAPTLEDGVKFSGGAVAALLAMRYASSLRSACVVGLLSGLFSHSLYADVLRKKRRRKKKQEEEEEEEEEDTATDSN
ncbi:hypothetical protein P3T76_015483 [Phytophthora citrophthora]|uniref:Uncharacterized protein n=1 Tax=Phytophthora citrophthora TaxID=4793 RepID=A0AAD9FZB3_9STRA|nr:hypothetical protein P3T76_015483 [Phytophthora citrophthora]